MRIGGELSSSGMAAPVVRASNGIANVSAVYFGAICWVYSFRICHEDIKLHYNMFRSLIHEPHHA